VTQGPHNGRPVAFSPDIVPDDPLALHWLRQVTFRLRREVLWAWVERGVTDRDGAGVLPPPGDRAGEALDLARHAETKRRFFDEDETARYLSEEIARHEPAPPRPPRRGSFSWVCAELALEPVERFLLALAALPGFDSAAGSVIAACAGDAAATRPTLALAQRLWDDDPVALLTLAEPGHRLFALGLLEARDGDAEQGGWDAPLSSPAVVVRQLLFPDSAPPATLSPVSRAADVTAAPVALGPAQPDRLGIVPVVGPRGAEHAMHARAVVPAARPLEQFTGAPALLARPGVLDALACNCWLRGTDLLLGLEASAAVLGAQPPRLPHGSIPIGLFLAVEDTRGIDRVARSARLPAVEVPRLEHDERVALWRRALGDAELAPELPEIARRFRFEPATIRTVGRRVRTAGARTRAELVAACRAELAVDLGELAQEVRPRFRRDELVLPHRQSLQLDEIVRAMRSLTAVHYEWGTARTWDEAGLAVMFAGPPGTGKTMAAEVLAAELALPLYRVDLSQVVDKYIGETEKNLRRVFDACEASDLVVLFDEADALFGRRTQVRDAHDRYANLEVSYLLSRMERAKGLTILATNRKEDIDGAFLRRLRHVVDFPMPDVAERRRIWSIALPEGVDTSSIDVVFLAGAFPLAGGHIRSAVFNACLQSAARASNGEPPALAMEDVLVAVWRELDKAERTISLERFGPYADLVRSLEYAEAGG
jgi:hypothetical protein